MRARWVVGIVIVAVATVANPGVTGSAAPAANGITVVGGSAEQRALARWAAGRFDLAGLQAPTVEVHFDPDRSGCGGHVGYAEDGRVDLCTVIVNAMTKRILLHELGHVWLDENVSASARARFLELRGLSAWNDRRDPWDRRGYEQAAEILAWGLGDRTLTPAVPGADAEDLEASFILLTGVPMPDIASG